MADPSQNGRQILMKTFLPQNIRATPTNPTQKREPKKVGNS
jgi:hypothetical protein